MQSIPCHLRQILRLRRRSSGGTTDHANVNLRITIAICNMSLNLTMDAGTGVVSCCLLVLLQLPVMG